MAKFTRFRSIGCLVLVFISTFGSSYEQELRETYRERLLIRPLDNGKIHMDFEFITFKPTSLSKSFCKSFCFLLKFVLISVDNTSWTNDLFPMSLEKLFHRCHVQEMHLSLSQGAWKHEVWGAPFREASPKALVQAYFTNSIKFVCIIVFVNL